MAIKAKCYGMYGVTDWTVQKGINFTSDAVTNAPVSKVYFNDKLVWAPYYSVTMSYPANTLDRIEYTRGFPGENGYEKSALGISSSGTTITLKCMEGQLLQITPVPKSGYTVTSYHGKPITITGDITIKVTTKASTKGKLIAPVLLRGSEGRVDGSYRFAGTFENQNSVSVNAVANLYYIDSTKLLPAQTRDHATYSGQTFTNISPKSAGTGYTCTPMGEGPAFDDYAGKHLIAIKFTADGYEDSDWRYWSDFSPLVNSTAYTTGQIPELIINEGEVNSHGASLEGYAEYEDDDGDGDYTVYCSIWGRHPLNWPVLLQYPGGLKEVSATRSTSYYRRVDIRLEDMPPDNLSIKVTCYDPLGLFKSASAQITEQNLTEAEASE
jgi:hypothetical protein